MATAQGNYLAIIGDLVGSRKLSAPERSEVQKKFRTALEEVNREFRKEIAALFLITAGDEAQGILKQPKSCYEILRRIQIRLAPTEIVFGLGYGTLTTEIGEYAVGSDGPAFYRARQALEEAKNDRKAYGKSVGREVRLDSGQNLTDMIVNALFLAMSAIKSHWTKKQTEVLAQLELGMNPKEIAEKLEMALSNVSRTVDVSHYREYESLVEAVKSILTENFGSISYQ